MQHLFFKQVRASLGLTQEELARLMGYEQNYINMIENGFYPPTNPFLDRFAKAADINREDLYNRFGRLTNEQTEAALQEIRQAKGE